MSSKTVILKIQATDTDGICASQSPAAAGNLLINGALSSGGVATLAAAHIISINTASNDTAKSWIITGTNADGIARTETITGVNATTVNSTRYWKTITNIQLIGGGATTAIVGVTSTNGCISESIPVNYKNCPNTWASLYCKIPTGATATYTVQDSGDDVLGSGTGATSVWFNHASLVAQTANANSYYASPVKYIRLLATAISSTVSLTVVTGD
jgi:hypothetical protein